MIRFDLNMEHDEVYGKFVLTVCICSILYFCKKFADCKKTDSSSAKAASKAAKSMNV